MTAAVLWSRLRVVGYGVALGLVCAACSAAAPGHAEHEAQTPDAETDAAAERADSASPDAEDAGDPAPEPDEDAGTAPAKPEEDGTHQPSPPDAATDPPPQALPPPAAGPCAFESPPAADFTTDNPNCPHGVYTGDVDLADDFAAVRGCVRIAGNLQFLTTHKRDLSGLESLRVVDGNLQVSGWCERRCNVQVEFASLHGLDALRCVAGNLKIGGTEHNKQLVLDSLTELVEVGGDLDLLIDRVDEPRALASLRRVWGSVNAPAVLPLPALETIYGKLTPSPYRSDARPAPAPVLTYIGCDAAYVPCRDGFLGCTYEAASQADVDRLASCEKTHGALTLSGSTIRDLTPLQQLRTVAGVLTIGPETGTGVLTSLAGLDALNRSASLRLINLPELRSLRGLDNLGRLDLERPNRSGWESEGSLVVFHMDRLEDLAGLGALAWNRLQIVENAALRTLDGLRAAETALSINITHNPELRSISALDGLRHAPGSGIGLEDLPKLQSLAGLSQLSDDGWDLFVVGCHALRDLSGLAAATAETDLSLFDNAGLTSLAGWASGPDSTVIIEGSPLLRDLSALVGKSQRRLRQLTLARLPSLDLHSLSGLTAVDQLSLTQCDNLVDLSGLDALREIERLVLKDNAKLRSLSGAAQLQPLSSLEIDGNASLTSLAGVPLPAKLKLGVRNTTLLRDFSGLEDVAEIEDLRIVNNAGLESLSGLSGVRVLRTVDGNPAPMWFGHLIENNPQLVSLDGLTALENADFLLVQNNAGLQRLGNFPKLRELERLMIKGNPRLTSLAGMTALERTKISLRINDNAALTSLVGLEALQRAGELMIDSNHKLTSLDGLSGLRTVDGWIMLWDNPALVSLRALGGISSTGTTPWTISGNSQLPQCEIDQLVAHVPGAAPSNPTGNGPPGMCTSW